MASWTSTPISSFKSWFSGFLQKYHIFAMHFLRNGLELQTAISNTTSAVGRALTFLSIKMIRWLAATMSNSPLTSGQGPPTSPWSWWSTCWSTSAGRTPSPHTSSTLPRTQPMPRHIQVCNSSQAMMKA